MDRVVRHVAQRVVHPAHVPFVVETQSPIACRLRHPRPGRGLLSYHQCARETLFDDVIQMAQKIDGLEIFPAAIAIRDPLAFASCVVAIQQ